MSACEECITGREADGGKRFIPALGKWLNLCTICAKDSDRIRTVVGVCVLCVKKTGHRDDCPKATQGGAA